MQQVHTWTSSNESLEHKIKGFMHRKAEQYPELDLEQQADRSFHERTW